MVYGMFVIFAARHTTRLYEDVTFFNAGRTGHQRMGRGLYIPAEE